MPEATVDREIRNRPATLGDLDRLTEIMTGAFASDPVWGGWAFPHPDPSRRAELRSRFWRFNLQSALRYPTPRITEGGGAAAIWIPPGGKDLDEAAEADLKPLLADLVGDHADAFMAGIEAFDEAHPHDPPHYYLSLFATHEDHRGKGIGMQLLADNLAEIDIEGMPAYLESSNPANIPRYESVGFVKVGEFTLPNGPTLDTMWREPRA